MSNEYFNGNDKNESNIFICKTLLHDSILYKVFYFNRQNTPMRNKNSTRNKRDG